MKHPKLLGLVLSFAVSTLLMRAQTVVESFEYPSTDDLLVSWSPSANATVTLSDVVAPTSSGTNSMMVTFNFPSTAFATEFVNGIDLPAPVSIAGTRYVSFRIKGDPAFATADFRNLYIYAYDADGNFGRWGAPVPTTSAWQTANYLASTIEKPWNSTALPDLTRITKFAFYQYGSEGTIPAYTATIYIDDLTIRDTPLMDTPPVVETVVETFSGYADTAALQAAWTTSANAAVSITDDVAPLSAGTKAMKATFNFPSTAYTTEVVTGPELATPVYIAPEQYVTFRIKGDPAFTTADFRNLYIYAYDSAGNFGRWGGEVPLDGNWQIKNFKATDIEKPWNSTALPNMTQIVKFAFFQYGSEAAIPAYTATITIDDISIRNNPLVEAPVTTNSVVDAFEYETLEDLTAAWVPSPATLISVGDAVSPRSTGMHAMNVDFSFASAAWVTETVTSTTFTNPVAIGTRQYLSFRVKGDPAFAAASFRTLYLYAYDADGNFGRWGSPIPTTTDWTVFNFAAGAIEQPWNSTALPNLGNIVRFAFYQYGSGETPIDAYTASISIDELTIRNSPLVEFPLPAAPRVVVEDFETFVDTAALLGFYSYVNSPATTVTTASLETPAPQGSKALKLSIDFSAGTYPWGSIRSTAIAPFSFPTNAVLTVRFKGDAALAEGVDAGTSFWITFYDQSGRPMSFVTTGGIVASNEWTTLTAPLSSFGDTSTVDVGNLVQWRILVQARQGTAESPAVTGTFYVDDIRIAVPPPSTITVTGTPPAPFTGTPLTNIVIDETARTITADIPTTGTQGFLTISPARVVTSVRIEAGKLVVRW